MGKQRLGARGGCAASQPRQNAISGKILRDRRLGGLKFRRQVPIGRYVDFLCLRHRLILEGRPLHHNGAMQVFAEGQGSRVVWTSDFLPDEFGPLSAPLMEACLADLAKALARGP